MAKLTPLRLLVVCVMFIGVVVVVLNLLHNAQTDNLRTVISTRRKMADLDAKLSELLKLLSGSTTTNNNTITSPKPCVDDFQEQFLREKRFICVPGTDDGLGNLMFTFASLYGLAVALNKSLLMHHENLLLKYYKPSSKVIGDMCLCARATSVYEKQSCAFDDNLFRIMSNDGNYFPEYYFQSWRYFRDVEEDIRRQFAVRSDLKETVVNTINRIMGKTSKTSSRVSVGIHVRRGDIATNHDFIEYGYLLAPKEYFAKAMKYFRKKYEKVAFFVASDNVTWCKENLIGRDVTFIQNNSPEVDHAVISHCDHVIMSVGTFGWWAAYLAGGETIYYKHPAKDGSNLRKQFSADYSDYFYPGWIGME